MGLFGWSLACGQFWTWHGPTGRTFSLASLLTVQGSSKLSYWKEAARLCLHFLPARRGYQGQEGSSQLFFFPNVIQHRWIAPLARRRSSPASEPAALQQLHVRGSPEVHCSKGSDFWQELSSQQGNCCCAKKLPLCPSSCSFRTRPLHWSWWPSSSFRKL